MAKARGVKFSTLVGSVNYYSLGTDKQSFKWAWSRSRDLLNLGK